MVSEKPLKLLYAARRNANPNLWTPQFVKALERFGELDVLEDTKDWTDDDVAARYRKADVVLLDWSARGLPDELADDPGRLRYICHLNGSIRAWVSRRFIEQGFQVTNWGDHPADGVAEGALTLLLGTLKQLIPQTDNIRSGGWMMRGDIRNGTLHDLRIGIYGLGVIGRRFLELVAPFKPEIKGFDPYLENWPNGVQRMDSLDELCDGVECLVVTAGLTEETRNSVTARHFAQLPDGGIVINVARGAILDQPALFKELANRRLRAGLDVLNTNGKDFLEEDDPARQWPNLLLTAHAVARAPWNTMLRIEDGLSKHQEIVLDNVERFVSGKSLQHAFDLDRYDRST